MTRRLSISLLVTCVAAIVSSCSEPVPATLTLLRVTPKQGARLMLNQSIEFEFDHLVDPSSVNEETLRIVDQHGLPVPGNRIVSGTRVRFRPTPPTDPDLTNGSFRPGVLYRVELPRFPLSQAIRGTRGEVLVDAKAGPWRAVTLDDLPPEFPTPFHPPPDVREMFVVDPRATVGPGERWIELGFNRPILPPSARRSAFELYRGESRADWAHLYDGAYLWGLGETVIIDRVEILAADGPGGYGSRLRIYVTSPLKPGYYVLHFRSGSRGVQDYGLSQLYGPQIKNVDGQLVLQPFSAENAWLEFIVTKQSPRRLIEAFDTPRPATEQVVLDSAGLSVTIDGALDWRGDGLYWPSLGFDEFETLGDLEPGANVELEPGRVVELTPGRSVHLPNGPLDFDRFIIAKGRRCFVTLRRPEPLRIRVAGRFEVHGELLFRIDGGTPPRSVDAPKFDGTPRVGDPSRVWSDVAPRVEIEVGGICRLTGRIELQTRGYDRVPGFLRGRGPFVGDWRGSQLSVWRKTPDPKSFLRNDLDPILMPGWWAVVSPWYPVERPLSSSAELYFEGMTQTGETRIRLQGRRRRGSPTWWLTPEQLRELGEADSIRFCVSARGGRSSGPILRRVEIR